MKCFRRFRSQCKNLYCNRSASTADTSTETPSEQQPRDRGAATTSAAATSSNNVNVNSGGSHQQARATSSTMGAGSVGAVEVPKSLQDGEKFVKWDEVSRFGYYLKSTFMFYLKVFVFNC